MFAKVIKLANFQGTALYQMRHAVDTLESIQRRGNAGFGELRTGYAQGGDLTVANKLGLGAVSDAEPAGSAQGVRYS